MIRLTGPGKLFLLVLFLFYAASFTSQSSLLLLLIGLVLGCLIVNGAIATFLLRQVEVAAPPSVHLAEGEQMAQPWKVTNRSPRRLGSFSIESSKLPLLRVPGIPARATLNLVPDVRFLQRGVYDFSQGELISGHPFGLVQARRRLALQGEVVVYPALYETPIPRASGLDAMSGGKFKGKRRGLQGAHFAGVRPIQSGDSLKQIHWKSSSKGRGLMVKTFEEELSGRIAFVLDCGDSGLLQTLDDCARATGSLLMTGSDAGHLAEWISLGDEERVVVPPFSDGHEILDRLARVQLDPGSLTEEALRWAIERLSVRSTLYLMLTALPSGVEEVVSELIQLNRAVIICLPENLSWSGTLPVPVWVYSEKTIREKG